MFPFTLRQLEVFDTVCRKKSFREAAEELNISQPAISRQIAALEHQLGCSLFARNQGRTPHLTVQGMEFRNSLDDFLAAGRRLAASRRVRPQPPRRVHRVYIASHLMEDVVRPRLGDLLQMTSGLELDFLPVSPRLISARSFPRHKIDIGLYCAPHWEAERDLPGTTRLGEVSSGIYGHPAFYREGLSVADVSQMPFILPPKGSPEEKPTIDYLANSVGILPANPVAWSVHVDVIRQIIDQGTAVTYLLDTMVRPFCLKAVRLWEGPPWARIFYRASETDDEIAALLRDFFLSCITELDKKVDAVTRSTVAQVG